MIVQEQLDGKHLFDDALKNIKQIELVLFLPHQVEEIDQKIPCIMFSLPQQAHCVE